MKAILLSIKPEWLVKILNGEKTIEVRKLFPKDYVGWVYLYCSKSKPYLLNKLTRDICFWEEKQITADDMLNGKVVARFWCDKVEEIRFEDNGGFYETALQRYEDTEYITDTLNEEKICEKSCLDNYELEQYLQGKNGYAIHISKLEIFDEPKELSEFHTVNKIGIPQYQFGNGTCDYKKITKAPQNYCWVDDFFFNNEETKEPESVLIDEKETDGFCR